MKMNDKAPRKKYVQQRSPGFYFSKCQRQRKRTCSSPTSHKKHLSLGRGADHFLRRLITLTLTILKAGLQLYSSHFISNLLRRLSCVILQVGGGDIKGYVIIGDETSLSSKRHVFRQKFLFFLLQKCSLKKKISLAAEKPEVTALLVTCYTLILHAYWCFKGAAYNQAVRYDIICTYYNRI